MGNLPRAILELFVRHALGGSRNGRPDLRSPVAGEPFLERGHGGHARRRALDVRVVDHDVTKRLRGVDVLDAKQMLTSVLSSSQGFDITSSFYSFYTHSRRGCGVVLPRLFAKPDCLGLTLNIVA